MADNDRGQSLITKYVWVTDSSSQHRSALAAPESVKKNDNTLSGGNIVINGGTVTATGGMGAAGIGTGYANIGSNKCGAITISTGVTSVTAKKGNNSPNSIGKGGAANGGTQTCGTITIGGDATTYAAGVTASPFTYPAP